MSRFLSSLRFRLMLLATVSLLPVLGLSLYNAAARRTAATSALETETLRLARICAGHQERLLESARQLLLTLAQIPVVAEMNGPNSAALFSSIRRQHPLYVNIGMLDTAGNVLGSALPVDRPLNLAHRADFQRAMESRRFAVGDLQVGEITGRSTLNVALPIFGPNQEPRGVLFAAVDLAWVEQMARVAELPPHSALTITDQEGTVAVRVPDAEKWVGKRFRESQLGRRVFSDPGASGIATERGLDGIERIYAYLPISAPGAGNYAHLMVGIPKEVAFAEVRRELSRDLLTLAAIAALALAGAWIAGDLLILRSIRRLLAATKRVAGGDLSSRSGVARDSSELGELAASFDDMAGALERRVAESEETAAALRRSEAMFRNLFEASPDAVFVEDLNGNVIDVNPAACRLHRMERDRLINRNVLDLVPPDMREEVKSQFNRWVIGDMISLESKSLSRDGDEVIVDIRASHIEFKGQQALLFHVRDITQQKRAEDELRDAHHELERRVAERTSQLAQANAALRETTERFELVSQGTNDGIWDWDLRTNRVYFSKRWKTMLGYEDHELPNDVQEWRKRMHPVEREQTERKIADYLEGRTPVYENEHRLLAKDGSWRWILARGFALRDEQGRAYRFTGSHVDLTERIQAAEALKRLAAELRRSNDELEQFAYVASHDLQEPLRMVASYTQLLQRRYADRLDAAAQEFIAYAVDGARRMQAFINDLLDYSRVGTKAHISEPVNLNDALEEAVQNLHLVITETRAEVVREGLPTVYGDAAQLTRLFQNLISNSLKFCAGKPPRVHVTAEELPDGVWKVSVRDNGIGIAPQYFTRIFIIFQRLHTREEYPGTGIGLSVCKKIVERHGGTIFVESEPGQGATFSFTFPLTAGKVRGGNTERPHERTTSNADSSGGG